MAACVWRAFGQMGCVWYLSLNIMRRERASPIFRLNWGQETHCPLAQEGSFLSSKIMRWQCIQLWLDTDRVGERCWTEEHSAALVCCLWSDGAKAAVILCVCWTWESSANYFVIAVAEKKRGGLLGWAPHFPPHTGDFLKTHYGDELNERVVCSNLGWSQLPSTENCSKWNQFAFTWERGGTTFLIFLFF